MPSVGFSPENSAPTRSIGKAFRSDTRTNDPGVRIPPQAGPVAGVSEELIESLLVFVVRPIPALKAADYFEPVCHH